MLMKQTIPSIRRATLALLMMMLTTTTAWAEQVTEEEARQQAQNFLTSLRPNGGARRAPGTTPQLNTTRQVSGLYVFNLDGGGFVIVSNDDRAILCKPFYFSPCCHICCKFTILFFVFQLLCFHKPCGKRNLYSLIASCMISS